MLSDNARKIKRILYNMNFLKSSEIDIKQLAVLSSRTEEQVKEAINELVKEKELIWDKKNNTFQVVSY